MSDLESRLIDFDKNIFRITGLEKAASVIARHRALLMYLLVIGVVAYAGDIFSFSLNIDSENHAYDYGAKDAWVSQGRWGMYLLNLWLLPDAVMPFMPAFLATAGCAVGAFFFMLTLSEQRGPADYLAAPLAIACPVLYFALYFTTLGYGIGVAFTAVNVGMYLLTRWHVAGFILSVLLFAFGIGIYQAVLPLIAVIFAFYMVSSIADGKFLSLQDLFTCVGIFVLAMLVAYGCYEAIKQWMLYSMNLQYDEAYLSGFIKLNTNSSYLSYVLLKTFAAGIDYYTGGKVFYLYDLHVLNWLFYFCLAVVLTRIVTASQQSVVVRALGVLGLIASLLAPLAMHVMNGGEMPPRTTLGVPYVFAGLVFVTAMSGSNLVRLVVALLVTACFYKFAVINNRYAFANQMVWQSDREFSTRLLAEVEKVWYKLPPKTIHDKYTIELVGVKFNFETPVLPQREVIGASFYNWAAGDINRITRLFLTMGVFDYTPATIEQRLSVAEQAMAMPAWPAAGSVDVINGIIVMKIGEYNPNQIASMCQKYPDDAFCKKYMQ